MSPLEAIVVTVILIGGILALFHFVNTPDPIREEIKKMEAKRREVAELYTGYVFVPALVERTEENCARVHAIDQREQSTSPQGALDAAFRRIGLVGEA